VGAMSETVSAIPDVLEVIPGMSTQRRVELSCGHLRLLMHAQTGHPLVGVYAECDECGGRLRQVQEVIR